MVNKIKNMKNLLANFDNSDNMSINASNEANFSYSMSTNEELKSNTNLNNIKSCQTKKKVKINKSLNKFIPKKIFKENEGEKNNNDITKNIFENEKLFEDDCYCIEWPSSLNSLNDIMSSTADFSWKEENIIENKINYENKGFSFQSMPDMAENEKEFFFKGKFINCNLDFNKSEEKIDFTVSEDCFSKIDNPYIQEFEDKKLLLMDY